MSFIFVKIKILAGEVGCKNGHGHRALLSALTDWYKWTLKCSDFVRNLWRVIVLKKIQTCRLVNPNMQLCRCVILSINMRNPDCVIYIKLGHKHTRFDSISLHDAYFVCNSSSLPPLKDVGVKDLTKEPASPYIHFGCNFYLVILEMCL